MLTRENVIEITARLALSLLATIMFLLCEILDALWSQTKHLLAGPEVHFFFLMALCIFVAAFPVWLRSRQTPRPNSNN